MSGSSSIASSRGYGSPPLVTHIKLAASIVRSSMSSIQGRLRIVSDGRTTAGGDIVRPALAPGLTRGPACHVGKSNTSHRRGLPRSISTNGQLSATAMAVPLRDTVDDARWTRPPRRTRSMGRMEGEAEARADGDGARSAGKRRLNPCRA